MNDIFRYQQLFQRVAFFLLIIMAIFGNLPLFIVASIMIALFLTLKVCITTRYPTNLKVILSFGYIAVMVVQIVFIANANVDQYFFTRIIAAILLPLPFLLEWAVMRKNDDIFYLPSLGEPATISFEPFKENLQAIHEQVSSVGHVLSGNNIKALFSDLHRHNSLNYINERSLDTDFFARAEQSLDDPNLYIVVSNTGTPASQLIGLFTQKQFNHASLSFDRELSTIISYNGGERVYPPGLNPEMLSSLHKNDDASILIYRLPVTRAQKEIVLNTIREINTTGSAYNILGLITKRSLRRNIMFCSQFVYRMLEIADVAYFDKKAGDVRPTDFIELDYHRQLNYVDEIKF